MRVKAWLYFTKTFYWKELYKMDIIDNKILKLLYKNARMSVKDIAIEVSLTAPAVSERIKKMESSSIIAGYTVKFGEKQKDNHINAIISMSVTPNLRQEFFEFIRNQAEVECCHNVTGPQSYILMVACADMPVLERIIGRFQKYGQTSTQIILSTMEQNIELED